MERAEQFKSGFRIHSTKPVVLKKGTPKGNPLLRSKEDLTLISRSPAASPRNPPSFGAVRSIFGFSLPPSLLPSFRSFTPTASRKGAEAKAMETLMVDRVQSSLRLLMYSNAIFLCERLCAEFPSEVRPSPSRSAAAFLSDLGTPDHPLRGLLFPFSLRWISSFC